MAISKSKREAVYRKYDGHCYKVGVTYGNIIENEKPIVFFFETEEAKRDG